MLYKQVYKATNKIYFMNQCNFLCNFYQIMCSIPIQNHVHCKWIETKESPKYKPFDNIKDLSKRTFWYKAKGVTKRNPWVMLCSHRQLMTHSAIYTLPFTLQLRCCKPLDILQWETKNHKVHISNDDGLPNFITSTLLKIGSRVSHSSRNMSFPQ